MYIYIYIYIYNPPSLLHFVSASTRSEIGVSKIVYQLGYLILQCCVDICCTDRRKRKQATRSTHAVLKNGYRSAEFILFLRIEGVPIFVCFANSNYMHQPVGINCA